MAKLTVALSTVCHKWPLSLLGLKAAGLNATLHTCPTSHPRQLPIFTLSWPRLCWLKLVETAPPPFSLNPLPAEAIKDPTATCICVPLKLACMPLACIILCLQTGCQGRIPHMYPGLQVRDNCVICRDHKLQYDLWLSPWNANVIFKIHKPCFRISTRNESVR